MKAFTLDKYGVTRGGQMMCNILSMRKSMYGIVDRIHIAPNRFSLKEFGGTLTIEDFRNCGMTSDAGAPHIDQMYVHEDKIELVKRIPIVTNTKLNDISSSIGTNEPLRLKRSKPLKRDENNLEKTLGITRKKANL